MDRGFQNVYGDEQRAGAYADLEFPGTYYLAFRDLPTIIENHGGGDVALDFGCGTGRSTRFLKDLGFSVCGVDIAEEMLTHARDRDPEGEYVLIPDGDVSPIDDRRFDLVLCAFTFDNIPSPEKRGNLFAGLGRLLTENGRIVNLVSAPEIYVNEWTSFSTEDFPENRTAKGGDPVRIVMLDVPDRRPVEDVVWTDSDYRSLYDEARLRIVETYRPLGKPSDPFSWVSEAQISPWVIYVLGGAG